MDLQTDKRDNSDTSKVRTSDRKFLMNVEEEV